MTDQTTSGTLFICATPIGNLEDASARLIRTLSEADIIAAEDTRRTNNLLQSYNIKTPLMSFHEHNIQKQLPKLTAMLEDGKNIALVSDAGMPCISDPGYELVCACIEQQLPISVIPGPTACVTALALSGLPTERFVFEGFLPRGKKERDRILAALQNEPRTFILYEAPHRLTETLTILYERLGDRRAAVVRELTKRHEEIKRGGLKELSEYFTEHQPLGEFVLVIEGAASDEATMQATADPIALTEEERVLIYMNRGMTKMDAVKQTAKDLGKPKREIYDRLIK